MNQFSGEKSDQIKAVLLLVLKLYSLKDRSFKGVIYGMGSNDVDRTYDNLLERNLSNSYTTELTRDYELMRSEETFEKIYCAYNQTILQFFSESKISNVLWELVSERELLIFFQDPRINKNIKKRIFMCAVTNGFIENSDSWSSKVGIILHYWNQKQVYSSGEYRGSFDIILYMGNTRMNYVYDDNTKMVKIYKSSNDDPDLLYLFLLELSEILNKPIEELLKNVEKGSWIINKNKILKTEDGDFKMYDLTIFNPIVYTKCILQVDDDWIRLLDVDGYRIFNIETGLLATEYIPNEKYDFRVFGLNFIDMCKLGSFSQNFRVFYKSRDQCLNCLNDILVSKPKITSLTRRRLGLREDWDERKILEDKEDIIIEDSTSIIEQMMDVEISQESILEMIQETKIEEELSGLLDFIMQTDVIYSMKTTQRIQHTRRIYQNIRNLKYDLIVRNILMDLKINKQMISSASSIFKMPEKRNVIYSMVSYYDRIYQYESQKSPGGILIDINQDFMNKFGLHTSDEEIDV
jgi:hypothetical protein